MVHLRYAVLLMTVTLLALLPFEAAAQTFKHSGRIVGIDRDGGRIALEEIGPRLVEGGATVSRILTISMSDATPITRVRRASVAPSGYIGDFVEQALEPWDVFFFDFVTVECLHDKGRLIALKVTLVEPEMP